MATESDDFPADLPEPGWMERLAAIHRAIHAVLATRAEIFREELAEKGSLFGKGLAGIALAVAFAGLSLLVLTALVAALFAKLFGGPIAGITATLVLYLLITASAALFGTKKLSRVKPLDFPATRDELRKDLDALRKEPSESDEGAASSEALEAKKASVRAGEAGGGDRATAEDIEDRFRAGSE
ncbi:MAG TPA: phage holin family protein [Thermoanaerobaculia bacterium]|nr:phage holin family protein [Thermoanaerobaculia bacterium]